MLQTVPVNGLRPTRWGRLRRIGNGLMTATTVQRCRSEDFRVAWCTRFIVISNHADALCPETLLITTSVTRLSRLSRSNAKTARYVGCERMACPFLFKVISNRDNREDRAVTATPPRLQRIRQKLKCPPTPRKAFDPNTFTPERW